MIFIVVPIFNTSKYLKCCLDSIRNQSYTEWKCFLINDGSTDASAGNLFKL